MIDYAQEIRERLTMQQVVEAYGFEPNRGGYISCPFHGEKTPSLKIYPDDRGFHCFGCNQSGDVIDFVRHCFGLNFKQAMSRLNYDFNLSLPLGERLSAAERARQRRIAAEREKATREANEQKSAQNQRLGFLWDMWTHMDRNRMNHAPSGPDEKLHPMFIEALKYMDYYGYLIDCAESALE